MAMARVLGQRPAWPETHVMNAERLDFSDCSFDGLFSFSVFEHLEDPQRALRELNRVVRPGGLAYIALELFTSLTGSHDPRLWGNPRALPLWAHLRPSCAGRTQPNVYLNRLRMADWMRIAREEFDHVHLYRDERSTRKYLAELLPQERAELAEYTDDELCTQDLVILAQRAI